jgi:hypothetical protein
MAKKRRLRKKWRREEGLEEKMVKKRRFRRKWRREED